MSERTIDVHSDMATDSCFQTETDFIELNIREIRNDFKFMGPSPFSRRDGTVRVLQDVMDSSHTQANHGDFTWRMSYGPGMRWQRATEAVFIVSALLSGDIRLAFVPFVMVVLQSAHRFAAPVATLIALTYRPQKHHRADGLYFDLTANRGGCVISSIVHAAGIYLVIHDYAVAGWMMLAMPAGSFILSPTVGFCLGCLVYVGLRQLAYNMGLAPRNVKGSRDVQFSR